MFFFYICVLNFYLQHILNIFILFEIFIVFALLLYFDSLKKLALIKHSSISEIELVKYWKSSYTECTSQ